MEGIADDDHFNSSNSFMLSRDVSGGCDVMIFKVLEETNKKKVLTPKQL